jgi:hypothetical protein
MPQIENLFHGPLGLAIGPRGFNPGETLKDVIGEAQVHKGMMLAACLETLRKFLIRLFPGEIFFSGHSFHLRSSVKMIVLLTAIG